MYKHMNTYVHKEAGRQARTQADKQPHKDKTTTKTGKGDSKQAESKQARGKPTRMQTDKQLNRKKSIVYTASNN